MSSFLIIALFIVFTDLKAQEYCLQFSKKDKRTVSIKEGRNISFIFKGSEEWQKGKIAKITTDSLFLEQEITKSDILTERESNYFTTAYGLDSFRMMAYNNTPKAVGKGSVVVLLVAFAIIGGGAEMANDFSNENKNAEVQKKFFKKNVNFDKGWKAKVVKCD